MNRTFLLIAFIIAAALTLNRVGFSQGLDCQELKQRFAKVSKREGSFMKEKTKWEGRLNSAKKDFDDLNRLLKEHTSYTLSEGIDKSLKKASNDIQKCEKQIKWIKGELKKLYSEKSDLEATSISKGCSDKKLEDTSAEEGDAIPYEKVIKDAVKKLGLKGGMFLSDKATSSAGGPYTSYGCGLLDQSLSLGINVYNSKSAADRAYEANRNKDSQYKSERKLNQKYGKFGDVHDQDNIYQLSSVNVGGKEGSFFCHSHRKIYKNTGKVEIYSVYSLEIPVGKTLIIVTKQVQDEGLQEAQMKANLGRYVIAIINEINSY